MGRNPSFHLLANILFAGTLLLSLDESASEEARIFETVHTSNAALLNRLGLSPLRFPEGHHKKRLAGPEPPLDTPSRIHQAYGRRHGHKDSHVYIVKLPPSPPYYTFTRPHKMMKEEQDGKNAKSHPNLPVGFHSNGKPGRIYHWNLPIMKKIAEKKRLKGQESIDQESKRTTIFRSRTNDDGTGLTHPVLQSIDQNFKKDQDEIRKQLHVNLNNPPATQKIVESMKEDHEMQNGVEGATVFDKHTRNNDKRLNYPGRRTNGEDEKEDKLPKPNSTNKTFRLEDSMLYKVKNVHGGGQIWNLVNGAHNFKNANGMKQKKHKKKAAMSYYAPMNSKSGSTSLQKNFPGNGKPKAFYVIEKSRKPVYYHPLLP